MIDVRERVKKFPGLAGFLARNDYLYTLFTKLPDHLCRSIHDLQQNQAHIQEGRLIELRNVRYFPTRTNSLIEIEDPTGIQLVRPYFERSKIERFFDTCLTPSLQEILTFLQPGETLSKILLQKEKEGLIYITDLELQRPLRIKQKNKDLYLLPKNR